MNFLKNFSGSECGLKKLFNCIFLNFKLFEKQRERKNFHLLICSQSAYYSLRLAQAKWEPRTQFYEFYTLNSEF